MTVAIANICIGDIIKVFWKHENRAFSGIVSDICDTPNKVCRVFYTDGTNRWHDFKKDSCTVCRISRRSAHIPCTTQAAICMHLRMEEIFNFVKVKCEETSAFKIRLSEEEMLSEFPGLCALPDMNFAPMLIPEGQEPPLVDGGKIHVQRSKSQQIFRIMYSDRRFKPARLTTHGSFEHLKTANLMARVLHMAMTRSQNYDALRVRGAGSALFYILPLVLDRIATHEGIFNGTQGAPHDNSLSRVELHSCSSTARTMSMKRKVRFDDDFENIDHNVVHEISPSPQKRNRVYNDTLEYKCASNADAYLLLSMSADMARTSA